MIGDFTKFLGDFFTIVFIFNCSDIGDEVISGRRLSYCTDERNPCR